MSWWGDDFWSGEYWNVDYWSLPSGSAPSYTQYPDVTLTIGPAGTQDWSADWDHTGDPVLVLDFAALQSHIAGDHEQTGNPSITFSPSGTQSTGILEYDQTGDAGIIFSISALQAYGLIQSTDVTFTTGFTAQQIVDQTLAYSQDTDATFTGIPLGMQVHLTKITTIQASDTVSNVEGFPDSSELTLSPVLNMADEIYFEFLIYSNAPAWLKNEGFAGQPVYIEVSIAGTPVVSVNLYKARFMVDYTMGDIYNAVRDGLTNKNLSVELSAYELFDDYVLSNSLVGDTTVVVRGHNTRVEV